MGTFEEKVMNLLLLRGDITTLEVECIVNASNESGLGCHIPNHCIDSAIFHAAGPKLLEACMKLNGIPTTIAKITPAFDLPSKYIIHVTGPRKLDNKCNFDDLEKSYINCLDLARTNNIKEIAFCCISTGIFGFPKQKSAEISLQTVKIWILSNPS